MTKTLVIATFSDPLILFVGEVNDCPFDSERPETGFECVSLGPSILESMSLLYRSRDRICGCPERKSGNPIETPK